MRGDDATSAMKSSVTSCGSIELKRSCSSDVSRRKIAAVGAQIDAAQHDFSRARCHKLLDFGDDVVRGETTTLSANEGNNAIRAAIVATVLDFQDGARAFRIAFGERSDLHGRLLEDVARENFRRAARKRHGFAIQRIK
jgi:hypothetical protein